MHAFWLVFTYDLLEDRRIDDVIIKTFSVYFNSLLYKTNRFQVAVRLFCYVLFTLDRWITALKTCVHQPNSVKR